QYSPVLELVGQGFSGASHVDKLAWQVQPSGAADTANMSLQQSMNGALYSTALNFDNSGNITAPNSSSFLITNSANNGFWATSANSVLYVAGANVAFATTGRFAPGADLVNENGGPANRWTNTWSRRYSNVSQNLAFSATPAFDCTAGEMIHIG